MSSHFWHSLSAAVWCFAIEQRKSGPNKNRNWFHLENNKYPHSYAASSISDATANVGFTFCLLNHNKKAIDTYYLYLKKKKKKITASTSSSNCLDFSLHSIYIYNLYTCRDSRTQFWWFFFRWLFSRFKLKSNWTKTRKLTLRTDLIRMNGGNCCHHSQYQCCSCPLREKKKTRRHTLAETRINFCQASCFFIELILILTLRITTWTAESRHTNTYVSNGNSKIAIRSDTFSIIVDVRVMKEGMSKMVHRRQKRSGNIIEINGWGDKNEEIFCCCFAVVGVFDVAVYCGV